MTKIPADIQAAIDQGKPVKLTQALVAALDFKEREYQVSDSVQKGLYVRLRNPGKKAYYVFYRTKDKVQRRPKVGDCNEITLDGARRIVGRWMEQVRGGGDPSRERKDARQDLTFSDFADIYFKHVKGHKKASTVKEDKIRLNAHVTPILGTHKLNAIDRGDIARLHTSLRETPIAANRVIGLLSAMFNTAELLGHRRENTNPCSLIQKYKETARKRYLSPEELRRLARAIAKAEQGIEVTGENEQKDFVKITPWAAAAIRLLLLTGCRRNEILNLEWNDIDVAGARLTLRDAKTGAREVMLNAAALEVIATIPRVDDCPFVFLSDRRENEQLQGIRKPWEAVCKLAEIKDCHLHDLRHSFAAQAVSNGLSLPMVAGLLGHVSGSKATGRYSHLMTDPLREATEAVGREIAAAMNGKGAEIVEVDPVKKSTNKRLNARVS